MTEVFFEYSANVCAYIKDIVKQSGNRLQRYMIQKFVRFT